ncbi:MAG: hypothetical protein ABWX69_03050, partial [Arthrobacter sp.]
RHYPSEHQDWEPPAWLGHLATGWFTKHGSPADPLPDYGLPADPLHEPDPSFTGHPDQDPGTDPGTDPGLELPQDPFPDWHEFTAAHHVSAAEKDDPRRPGPLDVPHAEDLLLLGV